ncbi:methyl-CpG-binding domain protein 3-like 1 [Ochotona curzoniae]|uniref:methyl-CpG-binding domain protein 3-like 1 n=1 Tax=Ochotona curzoniae TaxID=130825 RepID=UPI001B34D8B7|nr:methyl-CpG-binding domain protein 3-like 1 [Ochotona curzoniae]
MTKTSQKRLRDSPSPPKARAAWSTSSPLRMSSYILKRPVTRVTSHAGNEVRYHQWDETLDKPQQVCWQKRMQGLQASSSTGEQLSTPDLAKVLQQLASNGAGVSPPQAETAPALARHSPWPEPTPGGEHLGLSHSFYKPFLVTEEDIKRQEKKVETARERLALAMIADRLASEREKVRGLGKRTDETGEGKPQ